MCWSRYGCWCISALHHVVHWPPERTVPRFICRLSTTKCSSSMRGSSSSCFRWWDNILVCCLPNISAQTFDGSQNKKNNPVSDIWVWYFSLSSRLCTCAVKRLPSNEELCHTVLWPQPFPAHPWWTQTPSLSQGLSPIRRPLMLLLLSDRKSLQPASKLSPSAKNLQHLCTLFKGKA